jgi:hypothetical protein
MHEYQHEHECKHEHKQKHKYGHEQEHEHEHEHGHGRSRTKTDTIRDIIALELRHRQANFLNQRLKPILPWCPQETAIGPTSVL